MVEEFMPVPQLCRLILTVYEDDLCNPTWLPPEGGLNLAKEGDYAVLLDNKLGQTKFDGGYVHNGGRGGGIVGVDCGSESGQVGEQNQMLCYCTCMSLNLADVINFVVAARHDGCRWWWWWCQWLGMRDGGRQLWIVNGCEKKGKRNVGLPTCRWFCLSQNGVV
ncbi:hypothetical protein KPL71_018791 [Citrus sinensis]|uniref:Uncharacterized protein n=1 Tax=Citrus sinensis TaxID=2711 RepID=A0ACB8JZZ6_CITSI|nr:hypothetical protein KPL71_018791 [Citrus sinensis]